MLRDSATHSEFIARHIGPSEADQRAMLVAIGTTSLDALIREVVPENILSEAPYLDLPGPLGEVKALADLKAIALARVPAGSAPGDRAEVEIRGKWLPAEIVRPPFVRNGQALV